jgi:hypothetical protein
VARCLERILYDDCKVGGARQFVAVAKHGHQAGRNLTVPTYMTDQPLGNTVRFERIMKPAAPALICVAIADKREVPKVGVHVSSIRLIDDDWAWRDEPAPLVRQYTPQRGWSTFFDSDRKTPDAPTEYGAPRRDCSSQRPRMRCARHRRRYARLVTLASSYPGCRSLRRAVSNQQVRWFALT